MFIALLHARMSVLQSDVTQSYVTQSAVVTQSKPECESGWKLFDNMCYKFYPEGVPLSEADKKCGYEGADVITIQSRAENTFMKRILDEAREAGAFEGTDVVWLGGRRASLAKPYYWSTGRRVAAFTSWADGEPRNTALAALCIRAHRNDQSWQLYEWRSGGCNSHIPYVCERPTSTAGSTTGVSVSLICTAVGVAVFRLITAY